MRGDKEMNSKLFLRTALCGSALLSTNVLALAIDFTPISTPFNTPIGIDYYEPTNAVVMSVNYSSGQPHNFEIVNQDGTHTQFSAVSGLTDEVKIATAKGSSKFGSGTLFTGTGVNGQILRINADGTVHSTINLPGGDGLMRGSLFVDNTGVYNGDLIAVTTGGQVWRVDELGSSTLLADVNVHLEGLLVLPNDPVKWGSYAGRIIAGAEAQGNLYTFDDNGLASLETNIGVNVEDIDLIVDGANFFGVNFGTGRLLGAEASQWDSVIGDVLLTQEFFPGGTTGLWTMRYDDVLGQLVTEAITLAPGSFSPGQWEHVTFASAGIVEIPPVNTPEPGIIALLSMGLIGIGYAQRRKTIKAG